MVDYSLRGLHFADSEVDFLERLTFTIERSLHKEAQAASETHNWRRQCILLFSGTYH